MIAFTCVCASMCIYTKRAPGVIILPTLETGNGSNMGWSVASADAPGSDLSVLSGRGLQEQGAKMDKVKNTDVFSGPFAATALCQASEGPQGLLIIISGAAADQRWGECGAAGVVRKDLCHILI